MTIWHIYLAMCFSLLEFAFQRANGIAHLNAESASTMPWISSVQTYQIKIGKGSCSVFMISPSVGITAAHCFNRIATASLEFQSHAGIPKFIQTYLTGSIYATNNVDEISKVEEAYIRLPYYLHLKETMDSTPMFSDDFAYIRINPKLEIHKRVSFSNARYPGGTIMTAAGCKVVVDMGAEPRSCITQLKYLEEHNELDACFVTIGAVQPNLELEDCMCALAGYSGGPVTVDNEDGGKDVVGYVIGGTGYGYLSGPYGDTENLGTVVVCRLNKFLPLIKELIIADDEGELKQPRLKKRIAKRKNLKQRHLKQRIVKQKHEKPRVHQRLVRQQLAKERIAKISDSEYVKIIFIPAPPPTPYYPRPPPAPCLPRSYTPSDTGSYMGHLNTIWNAEGISNKPIIPSAHFPLYGGTPSGSLDYMSLLNSIWNTHGVSHNSIQPIVTYPPLGNTILPPAPFSLYSYTPTSDYAGLLNTICNTHGTSHNSIRPIATCPPPQSALSGYAGDLNPIWNTLAISYPTIQPTAANPLLGYIPLTHEATWITQILYPTHTE